MPMFHFTESKMKCAGRRVSILHFTNKPLENPALTRSQRTKTQVGTALYTSLQIEQFLIIMQNIIWVLLRGTCPPTFNPNQATTNDIRKLARLRAQLLEPTGGSGGGGSGFDVSKSGDARVALVGFPSVGKSTFLSKITKTKSEAAAYSFTTLTAIPGVLEYGGAEIQILDLPGIIEGASEGKGRGRQVISAAKVGPLLR